MCRDVSSQALSPSFSPLPPATPEPLLIDTEHSRASPGSPCLSAYKDDMIYKFSCKFLTPLLAAPWTRPNSVDDYLAIRRRKVTHTFQHKEMLGFERLLACVYRRNKPRWGFIPVTLTARFLFLVSVSRWLAPNSALHPHHLRF